MRGWHEINETLSNSMMCGQKTKDSKYFLKLEQAIQYWESNK